MPQWLVVALIGAGAPVLVFVGAIVGHVLSARAQKRAADVQAEASKVTAEHKFIDQLQEELAGYRTMNDNRALEQDRRMNELEERNGLLTERSDRYRDLLHKHRTHIWNGLPPPPPEWPDDLPR